MRGTRLKGLISWADRKSVTLSSQPVTPLISDLMANKSFPGPNPTPEESQPSGGAAQPGGQLAPRDGGEETRGHNASEVSNGKARRRWPSAPPGRSVERAVLSTGALTGSLQAQEGRGRAPSAVAAAAPGPAGHLRVDLRTAHGVREANWRVLCRIGGMSVELPATSPGHTWHLGEAGAKMGGVAALHHGSPLDVVVWCDDKQRTWADPHGQSAVKPLDRRRRMARRSSSRMHACTSWCSSIVRGAGASKPPAPRLSSLPRPPRPLPPSPSPPTLGCRPAADISSRGCVHSRSMRRSSASSGT